VRVRLAGPQDRRLVEGFLEEHGAARVAWLGELVDAREHQALPAEEDGGNLYQRRGFRLAKLHESAVDRSREALKPEIPEIGEYGIRLRDELEMIKEL
jgi:hypothetical protein